MAQLYGSQYGKADILAHVGDISQEARIKPYRLVEGLEDGVLALDVTTANCMVMGRTHDRAEGTLQFLEPGEKREYHLEIGVLAGPEEIAAQERACRAAVAAQMPGA